MKKKIIVMILSVVLLGIGLILIFNKKSIITKKNNDNRDTDRIPVFTFHRLVPDNIKKSKYKDNQWVGSIDVFEEIVKYLYDNDYHTISSRELNDWYNKDIELDKKSVMITFDDGFYEDYYLAYPILKKYNMHAISFVVGSRVKNKTKKYDKNKVAYIGQDVIDKVRKEYPKFEFQSHTYNMHFYSIDGKHRIKRMSTDDLNQDFEKNSKFNFNVIAYPYGDYNNDMLDIVSKQNYILGFRFSKANYAYRTDNRYTLGRIKINGNADVNTIKKWLNY